MFFQFEEGGPIIAVQVENEYGSYAKDENYMPYIKNVGLLMCFNVFFIGICTTHCNVVFSIYYPKKTKHCFSLPAVSRVQRDQGAPADFRQLGGLEIWRDGGR